MYKQSEVEFYTSNRFDNRSAHYDSKPHIPRI